MTKVYLICDRCNTEFVGNEYVGLSGLTYAIGYYRFYNQDGNESIWWRFARGLEEVVCRECMWSDEKYLDEYPHFRNEKIKKMIREKA